MLAPASMFSKIAETGIRVPLRTHAPLTLPGTRSTAGHLDQSKSGILHVSLKQLNTTFDALVITDQNLRYQQNSQTGFRATTSNKSWRRTSSLCARWDRFADVKFQTRFSFRLLSFTEDPPFGVLERIKIPCDTLTTGETLSQLHSPVLVPAAAFVRKHGNALQYIADSGSSFSAREILVLTRKSSVLTVKSGQILERGRMCFWSKLAI